MTQRADPRSRRRFRLAGIAVAVSAAIASGAGAATTDSDDLELNSLSGIYLAARLADAERDISSAAEFYRAAHEVDPDNQFLLDRALVLTAAAGDIEQAVVYAEKLVERSPSNRVARLVRAVRAIRAKTYTAAVGEIDRHRFGRVLHRLKE